MIHFLKSLKIRLISPFSKAHMNQEIVRYLFETQLPWIRIEVIIRFRETLFHERCLKYHGSYMSHIICALFYTLIRGLTDKDCMCENASEFTLNEHK